MDDLHVVAHKRRAAGQNVVQQDTQRVLIDGGIGRVVGRKQLGGHKLQGAGRAVFELGHRRFIRNARDAKVEHLYIVAAPVLRGEHDVLRLNHRLLLLRR